MKSSNVEAPPGVLRREGFPLVEEQRRMAYSKEEAAGAARKDLAARLGVSESEVAEDSVEEADFPDASLGAPLKGEMSGMMITPGWRIRLSAAGKSYEYRANRNQLRLYKFKGANHKI